jgi:hypothetical protein
MIRPREALGKQVFKLAIASVSLTCLGAAVFAAPLYGTQNSIHTGRSVWKTSYGPLAPGPSVRLGHADRGEDEDCVKVTRVTGPDGRVYVTRGLICAQ